jgi:uncharacterized glyoxalase superfamily protein PhnB
MADTAAITVWPILHYDDTEGARAFLVEVLGFQESVLARDDRGQIVHAELRWPPGGTVLFGSAKHVDSIHGQLRPGAGAMYVPTRDVDAVHQRALHAGAEIVEPPSHTRFGSGVTAYAFTLKDTEGYLWTFGTYLGTP